MSTGLRRVPVHMPDRPRSVDPALYRGQIQSGQGTSYAGLHGMKAQWAQTAHTPTSKTAAGHHQHHPHHSHAHSRTQSSPIGGITSLKQAKDARDTTKGSESDWRTDIQLKTRKRFEKMKREAEFEMQKKLKTGSPLGAQAEMEELRRNLDDLEKVMEEEETILVEREEAKRSPVAVKTEARPEDGDEEWLWRPDQPAWKEAVVSEQQVIWDTIKRNTTPVPVPVPGKSRSSHRRRDSESGFATDVEGMRPSQSPKRIRWADDVGALPPGRKQSISEGSPRPSTPRDAVHQRWIPSVNEYAADFREQAARSRSSSNAGGGSSDGSSPPDTIAASPGTSPGSVGSWRDWRRGSVVPDMLKIRRGPTPVPTSSQPLAMESGKRRAQTPMPAGSGSMVSESSKLRRAHTPGPARSGLYEQQLEDMAARLRRELSIPS